MLNRPLDLVEKKATSFFACQADPRFSHCLYVPSDYDEAGSDVRPLVVVLHGSLRTAEGYRSDWAAFAEETGAVILAPLFPAGIIEPDDIHNYKLLKFHDIRFDLILLAMVDEVAAKYRVDPSRFMLHGFSGGGQFAHRFLYLHPQRLSAISIGAPGMVTLLDDARDWWVGTRGMEAVFGTSPDLAAMRSVPVQMIVGADDTDTDEITVQPDVRYFWMEGANDAGRTRIDRLQALRDSFEARGIAVRFEAVEGVGHAGMQVQDRVRAFFREVLSSQAA